MEMTVPDTVRQTAARAASAALAAARDAGGSQYLTFHAAGGTYALAITGIKEIIEFGAITVIPLMPACIRGVINLRGSVVPVLDLSARLGFARSATDRRTCIVIVEVAHDDETLELGLVVDGVTEVVELGAADLEPAPSFGANIRSDFIQAMARVRGQFVIVMRLEQVLSVDEVSSLSHLEPAADTSRVSTC